MKTSLEVQNISCSSCANSIESALKSLPSVRDVEVDIPNGIVSVSHDEKTKEIVQTINKAGYPVKSWQSLTN